jgi:hypothetical protein
VLLGLVGVAAIPAGIALARYESGISLLDAAWAIPVAALASAGALLAVRGKGGHVRYALERVAAVRVGRFLGVAGICLTLSAAISVGFYELLLRLEG